MLRAGGPAGSTGEMPQGDTFQLLRILKQGTNSLRILVFTLICVSTGCAQVPDSQAFRIEDLRSGDHARRLKCMAGIAVADIKQPEVLELLLGYATDSDEGLRGAATRALERMGKGAVPFLLASVESRRSRRPVVAIRWASRLADAPMAAEFVTFLDDPRKKVAQATVSILARTGMGLLPVFRSRLAELRSLYSELSSDADTDERERLENRLADTLGLLSAHGAKTAAANTIELRASGSPRFKNMLEGILRTFHPDVLHPIARRGILDGRQRNANAFFRFISARDLPGDRRLGLDAWKALTKPEPRPLEVMSSLLDATSDWLGIIVPPPKLKGLRYELTTRIEGSDRPTRHRLDSDRLGIRSELLRGITLELPLETALHQPSRCVITVRENDDSLWLKVRLPRTTTYRFGIGNSLVKAWAARFGFDVASIEVRLEPRFMVPLESRYFDKDGREVGRASFEDYADTGTKRRVPLRVSVESGGIRIVTRYGWHERGCRLLRTAEMARAAVVAGKREWRVWARADVIGLKTR